MHKKVLQLTLCLSLFSCGLLPVASPLKDKDEIQIQGRILESNGSPWKNGQVAIETHSVPQQVTTDQNGNYSLSLLGFETKFLDVASEVYFKATHTTDGSVSFQSKILEKSLTVPTMQFWNQLSSPQKDFTLTQQSEFKWEKPQKNVTNYTLTIYKYLPSGKKETMGSQSISETTATLDKELFENNTKYSWEITAHYNDYSATSANLNFNTSTTLNHHLEIQNATVNGKSWPEIHDGIHEPTFIPDSIKAEDKAPLPLILDLGESRIISGFYLKVWAPFDNFAKIYISDSLTERGKSLRTLNTKSFSEGLSWVDLPDQQGRYLILEVLDDSKLTIKELRILGG